MVSLAQAIDELNKSNIIPYKENDTICSTAGEVVIYLRKLQNLLTADTEAVIRCSKCRFCNAQSGYLYCSYTKTKILPDDYCSHGTERM